MYDIEVDYIGQLNDRLVGFYRARYTNPDGESVYVYELFKINVVY